MLPLTVLLGVFLIALLLIKFATKKFNWQFAGRIAMSAMLLFTAIAHFIFDAGMIKMVPDMIPLKKILVYATGVLEAAFAVGLLIPKIQKQSAWLLILFFIAIFPANIKATMDNVNYQTGEPNGYGLDYLWFRIPLQILFIVWTYYTAISTYKTNKAY